MKATLYARVSTVDKEQNPEVQLLQLRKYCQDNGWEICAEYVDKASATDLVRRKEWTRLMKDASIHKFNVLLVWKIDRAFRSVIHAVNTLEILNGYSIGFRSLMEPAIDTTTPMGQFVFNVLTAVSQLERETISQRVRAGLDYTKRKGTRSGKAIGRPRKDLSLTIVCKAVQDGKGNYSEAARIIKDSTGIEVTPGFVQLRLQRADLTIFQVMEGAYVTQS